MVLGIFPLFPITQIPIRFVSYSKLPIVEVEIEGIKYDFELDTGASGEIILRKDILEEIQNKEFQGIVRNFDIKGALYESSEFLLPHLKLGNAEFELVRAREENLDLITDGCIVWNFSDTYLENQKIRLKNIAGRIGWGILKRHQWYFDFSHSLLWIVEDLNELKNKVSYFSQMDYVNTPFEVGKAGITFSVETDIGIKKLVLDTGANIPCLRKTLVETKYAKEFRPGLWMYSSKVEIGKLHFGVYPFFLYEFTSKLDVDGIMSVQFFEKNGIYLDFKNHRALIGPAKQSIWSRILDGIIDFGEGVKKFLGSIFSFK
jgi:hypothetical protein